MIKAIVSLLCDTWNEESNLSSCGESLIAPVCNREYALTGDHREVSLIPVIIKTLTAITLRHLTPIPKSKFREQQAGFHPDRDCIDQVFTLRQLLKMRHIHRRPAIVLFLDMKSVFDPVDQTALLSVSIGRACQKKS